MAGKRRFRLARDTLTVAAAWLDTDDAKSRVAAGRPADAGQPGLAAGRPADAGQPGLPVLVG